MTRESCISVQHGSSLEARDWGRAASANCYALPRMQAEMTSVNLLPLLNRLAGESDELLRRSLLTAVTAMAQSGASEEHMTISTREAWAEKVLTPLLRQPCYSLKIENYCRGTIWELRKVFQDTTWQQRRHIRSIHMCESNSMPVRRSWRGCARTAAAPCCALRVRMP